MRRRSELLTRCCLLAAVLVAPWAAAQGTGSACLDACSKTVTSCSVQCKGDAKCSNSCMKRFGDCTDRCQKNGKLETLQPSMAKQRDCVGPNGKTIKCSEYQTKAPKQAPEPVEQYPNKAAKALGKNPDFKDLQ